MTTRKGRKISGGKYIKRRKKRKCELAGQKRIVKLGEEKRRSKRTLGGNKKTFLLKSKLVNVTIHENKATKTKKVEIKNVIETPSNRFLARQNIITKGTILDAEIGRVKVTNRPAQEGVINGILIE